jgi:predicted cation transporter
LGLLISGGILIPGNIPNIIAVHALHIKSTEWVKLGVPLGLVIMTFTAVVARASLADILQISLPEDQDRELLKLGFRA